MKKIENKLQKRKRTIFYILREWFILIFVFSFLQNEATFAPMPKQFLPMSTAGKSSVVPVVKVIIHFLPLPPPSIPDSEFWLITNPSYSPSTARISRTSIFKPHFTYSSYYKLREKRYVI